MLICLYECAIMGVGCGRREPRGSPISQRIACSKSLGCMGWPRVERGEHGVDAILEYSNGTVTGHQRQAWAGLFRNITWIAYMQNLSRKGDFDDGSVLTLKLPASMLSPLATVPTLTRRLRGRGGGTPQLCVLALLPTSAILHVSSDQYLRPMRYWARLSTVEVALPATWCSPWWPMTMACVVLAMATPSFPDRA